MKTRLIGISGKKGSGKNTVSRIIHCLDFMDRNPDHYTNITNIPFLIQDSEWNKPINPYKERSHWIEKSFAHKVKVIASLLTGINVNDFESQDVKKSFLSDEWKYNAIVKSDQVANGNGKMSVRDMLQRIGTDCMRYNLHPDTWINALFSDYSGYNEKCHNGQDLFELYSHAACESCGNKYSGYKRQSRCKDCIEKEGTLYPRWIITDVRFKNEAEAIVRRGGVLIRVNRPSDQTDNHPSETDLDSYNFGYVLNNTGSVEDLVYSACELLKLIP
jgi:hypothetical protein